MTSTRNKNMLSDYKQEQSINNRIMNNNIYSLYGKPLQEHIPSVGYIPSHMSRDTFSNNSVDIESSLYGIGSSNLVEPCKPVNPSMKNIYFKEWFETPNSVIMPYPLIYENNQRPNLS